MKKILLVTVIGFFTTTGSVWSLITTAETRIKPANRSTWNYSLSFGGGAAPKYPGSKNYKIIPLGSFSAKYNSYRIDLNGLYWTANIISRDSGISKK
ncbi:hypothetical protein PsalMR5_04583 (plasmid) [Piscirickettsia salmonis]|uniref:hypothetical protein n=1 Tax=Piscirickettsia salmonis TaxID=1238 RepID=UPI0012BAE0B0|nr:hypothetical protein [Piscirickettsia salmonis]QGP57171.1 hypothetical protein PsalSR1_04660 [Piscirickettsia salmonis]QGP61947.1 hypothetical protein PsalBI1_04589 [Piscirickettsia salmonis]QGP66658.1 hypothetical protein PsalMR5_04583 [Piscirickettsia salmonis]